jgi:hypothetical protein
LHCGETDNYAMTSHAHIIGRRSFLDGIVRPVFLNDADAQYVISADGRTRRYGMQARLPTEG